MTVLHLAARFGHVDVLEVLRGKVPWSMASVKVKKTNKQMQINFYCIRYYDTMIFWVRRNLKDILSFCVLQSKCVELLALYTLTSVCVFSILYYLHLLRC